MEKEDYDNIFGTFSNNNGNPKFAKFRFECEPCEVRWRSDKPRGKCFVCKAPYEQSADGLI